MKALLGALLSLLIVISAAPVQAVNLQNFSIRYYKIDYELSRDSENRSVLKTTETIVAQFPDFDQNHGIERAIPRSYDGHPVSLSIQSIKKSDGSSWNYSIYDSNDNNVVRIGDADKYVRGAQTYVIEYMQRDVTKAFSDTASDEFYWDTNGTEWLVPIDRLQVNLTIEDGLAAQLTGNIACYQGYSGASDSCDLKSQDNKFSVQANNLSAGQNVTIAIGFKPETFAPYKMSALHLVFFILGIVFFASLFITGFIALGILIWLIVKYYRWSRRSKELGTVIPEYLPPKDTSVTTAASLISPSGSVFTAQLLDFAVRHYIKIHQTKEKSLFRSAEYDIEIIKDIKTLKAEEQEILNDIFMDTAVGARLALKTLKSNTSVYNRIIDNDNKLKALVRGAYGFRHRVPEQSAWFKKVGWILFILSVLSLSPWFLTASITSFIMGYTLWPLTDKGLEMYRYLEGLKLYIGVAEAERLKMLQSPEGALKIAGTDPNNPSQLVKLYEKSLPYAVLFGQEKEWTKRIGEIHEASHSQPSWYAGNSAAFNAAVFSSAMSGFTTSASYSSASSSSSGGSSGGGSSGGGGGGGGGGGW